MYSTYMAHMHIYGIFWSHLQNIHCLHWPTKQQTSRFFLRRIACCSARSGHSGVSSEEKPRNQKHVSKNIQSFEAGSDMDGITMNFPYPIHLWSLSSVGIICHWFNLHQGLAVQSLQKNTQHSITWRCYIQHAGLHCTRPSFKKWTYSDVVRNPFFSMTLATCKPDNCAQQQSPIPAFSSTAAIAASTDWESKFHGTVWPAFILAV